jgi:hypothetical protein
MKWKMLIDIKNDELEIGSYFAVDNVIYQIMYDEYKKEYFLMLDSGRIIASDYNDKDIMMESLFNGALVYPVKPIQIIGDIIIFDIYSTEQVMIESNNNCNEIGIVEFSIDNFLNIIKELLEDEDFGEDHK